MANSPVFLQERKQKRKTSKRREDNMTVRSGVGAVCSLDLLALMLLFAHSKTCH